MSPLAGAVARLRGGASWRGLVARYEVVRHGPDACSRLRVCPHTYAQAVCHLYTPRSLGALAETQVGVRLRSPSWLGFAAAVALAPSLPPSSAASACIYPAFTLHIAPAVATRCTVALVGLSLCQLPWVAVCFRSSGLPIVTYHAIHALLS